MDTAHYASSISAEDLRLFLKFWPTFSVEADKAQQQLIEDKDRLLSKDVDLLAWCYLYELPIRQHIALANAAIIQGYDGFLNFEQVADWYRQLVDTPGQVGALPSITCHIDHHFDSLKPSKEDMERLLPGIAGIFSLGLSMYNSLRCVLYHGCFLNELIERVRADHDNNKALFDAIRIDSTVLGCPSVVERISKATLLQDNRFFAKLKAAINGKLAKREQANYQKMRLVLEVLHEAGAMRLNDEQLHQLFVEELKLYSGNTKGGGCAKALRKFADTYMKKNATT